jgi:hypothetical protein
MTRASLERAVTIAGIALVAAAVATELRKPARDRTWHGRVGGLVPYDFRRPTAARVRERCWNPDDGRLLTPQVFGVGWTLNLARVRDFVCG